MSSFNIIVCLPLIASATLAVASTQSSVETYGGSQNCTACVATSNFNGAYVYSAPPSEVVGNLKQYAMAQVDGTTLRAVAESRFLLTQLTDPYSGLFLSPPPGSWASASITDSLLIDTPSAHGQRGRMTITLQADWVISDYSGYYSIGASTGINVSDSTGINAEAFLRTEGLYLWEPSLHSYAYQREGNNYWQNDFAQPQFNAQVKFSIPITYGTPLNLKFFLEGAIGGYYVGDYSGVVRAENSAKWGGISNLVDSAGAPILDYSISSQSGIDWERSYIVAIPEPNAKFLLMAGLLAIGMRARFKSSRQS